MHAWPQPPQLSLSRVVPGTHGHGTHVPLVSMHAPPQHSAPSVQPLPPEQPQPPFLHAVPVEHLLSHLPQVVLESSAASQPSSSLPLQSSKPFSHVVSTHFPLSQLVVPWVGLQVPAQV